MMTKRLCASATIVTAILMMTAGTTLAKTSHPKSGQVDVFYPATIANNVRLQPGTYKVEIAPSTRSPEVMFYQHGKLAAEVPATLVQNGKKTNQTAVTYHTAGSNHIITEIDVRGWTESMKFKSASKATTATTGS